MSSAASPVGKPGLFQAIRRAVDWRLVAAIGLPVWAFIFGIVLTRKPAPPAPAPQPVEVAAVAPAAVVPPPAPQPPPAAQPETIPPPREIVIRQEVVRVEVPAPSGDPVAVEPQPAAPPVEFNLPASELQPAGRCKTFDTKISFHPDLAAATDAAKQSKKLILVLHISGNFDDPGFT